ncbi:hypothetical protein K160097B7_04970 [[Clostridium] hylemonae]
MYMKSTKKKRILRAAICLTCAVTIASVNTSVYAEPSTNELEGKTSDLQGELKDLNSQLSTLSDELDATSSKIEELSASVEKSKLDVAAAKLNEDAQYDAMKDRIKFMYEGGSASLLEILFSSENMADFLNKAEFVSNISTYDRQMLDELQAVRADIEKKQETLETQQEELAGLQSDLESKQEALNAKISSTSGELSKYSAQLERAKAAAAALKTAQDNSVAGSTSAPGKNTDKGNKNNNTDGNNGGTVNNGGSIDANVSDTALFAAILECEAGGSYDGMLAVATVIMNRVSSPSYPNSIRGVIYQSGQFAPTWDGSLNRVLARGPSQSAYSAAQAALGGARHAAVLNCYSFNAAWTGASGVNVGGNVFW